ncbi:uncharacterized protein LOC110191138 [Drosophila serrata]|uniref:uncharacterized protein LOC110191138 n=1 Tax=Drosophila serrata TaxID=7274 RepID=UPI000A1CFF97|nr:uncharacterized protein LOC110191138 [Drosophila serrata]KAH8361708.1 hypothetical protein KR200_009123 [Drosophila serrata]
MAQKTKEAMLAEMDLIFMNDILPTCLKNKTTSQVVYKDHTADMKRTVPAFRKQTDASLISGHYANNLKVDGLEVKTRTWPRSMDWREEYKQFVKRNKWCNEEIYKLIFVNPPVRYEQIKEYLRDLLRTTYMSDYSPHYYVSLKARRNDDSGTVIDPDSIDYQTTYGNYHNRIQEMDPFKAFINEEPKPKDLTLGEFEREMRKLFTKYNLTTYYEEYCLPALIKAKDGIMPSGPIDRYTLRRV